MTDHPFTIWQCPDCKRQLSDTGISHECIATGGLSYNFESVEVVPKSRLSDTQSRARLMADKLSAWAGTIENGYDGPSPKKLRRYAGELREL